ncbi:MAG: biopolymer transport protein ExbD [Celeribacter sp.]|jgi:biopolymer transport protein ExbD
MKLTRPRRREMPETIIPLIDVVFFLLIFFMLIGRMDASAPFDVTPAASNTGQEMPGGGATLSIGVAGDIALQGKVVTHDALMSGLQSILTTTPNTLIRVNAHKDASLQFVLPLVAQIEALGAKDVVLVVTPDVQ